jgi:hypothetical protein
MQKRESNANQFQSSENKAETEVSEFIEGTVRPLLLTFIACRR